MFTEIIPSIQAVVGILLIVSILMQNKGVGLSSTFGGSSEIFSTKRGVEKLLHNLTVILAIAFFALSIYQMFA